MLPVWPSAITERFPLIEKVNWRAKLVNFHLGELENCAPGCFQLWVDVLVQPGQVVQVKC